MLEIANEGGEEGEGEREKGEAEAEEGCRDPKFTIDPPYWRLNRNGKGFFKAPKNGGGEIDATRILQNPWIGTKDTSDYFLALGWLVEQGKVTRYVCALNLSTNPVSFWLVYDYLQRGDDEHLHVLDIPAVKEQGASDCDDDDDISDGGRPAEKRLNEQKRGFMSQPEPWDIACLYRGAFRDWPQDAAHLTFQSAVTSLLICGDPQPDLRATRIEPPRTS